MISGTRYLEDDAPLHSSIGLMHAETFAYLLHSTVERRRRIFPLVAPLPPSPSPIHVMMEIPGGTVTLGQPTRAPLWPTSVRWDNEFDES